MKMNKSEVMTEYMYYVEVGGIDGYLTYDELRRLEDMEFERRMYEAEDEYYLFHR